MITKKFIAFSSLTIIFGLTTSLKSNDGDISNNLINSLDNLNVNEDFLNDSLFNVAYKKFSYYNENIANTTVLQFVKVAKFYGLSDANTFNLCISQICYESRARQYRDNGEIMKSSANAIGIAQIVPTTGFHNLKNVLTDEDRKEFIELGATDMSFVDKYPRYKNDTNAWNETKKWLTNETNNIILWGYIMKNSLGGGRDINSTFVAYNGGGGYLNSWVKNGKSPNEHQYVRKISEITNNLSQL